MSDTGEAGGRENERERHFATEDGSGRVHVAHIAQNSRDELQLAESTRVAIHRDLVLGATIDVVEHAARKALARQSSKVLDAGRPLQSPLRGTPLEVPKP